MHIIQFCHQHVSYLISTVLPRVLLSWLISGRSYTVVLLPLDADHHISMLHKDHRVLT